jgi:hypothetical protein
MPRGHRRLIEHREDLRSGALILNRRFLGSRRPTPKACDVGLEVFEYIKPVSGSLERFPAA